MSRGVPWDWAEETAQAAWVRGWERRSQLRQIGMLYNWVNSIALNLYRTARRHTLLPVFEGLCAAPSPLDRLEIEQLLARCSAADREILAQQYLEGLTTLEMATYLGGCSPLAIRMRVHRAKANARRYLKVAAREAS